jgi:hypothetical protein
MTKTQRQHRIGELIDREVISTAAQLAEIVELDQYRDEVISVEVDSTEKAAEEEPVRPSTHRTVL